MAMVCGMARQRATSGRRAGAHGEGRADAHARLALLLASTLTILAAAVVAPSLPAMGREFAHVPGVALWTRLALVLPALFIVLGAPVAGVLADRAGRKRLLVASSLLYAVAGSSGAWLPDLPSLLVGRAILGLAVAGTMTAATTLLTDLSAGASRRRLLGVQGAFIGVGGALFFAGGGVLAALHWRTPFLLYLVSLALLPPIVKWVHDPAREPAPASGFSALPGGLVARVWTLTLFAQTVFFLAPTQLPFLLQDLGAPGAGTSGFALAALLLAYAGGSLVAARAVDRFARRPVFAAGVLLLGAGYGEIGLAHRWGATLPGLVAGGVGLGLLIPNLFARLADGVPAALRGRAMGGMTTAVFLGQFASPLVAAPLVGAFGLGGTFALGGILSLLVGASLALPVLRPRLRRA